MTEKVMQTLWGNYIKSNPPSQTEVYELKICKGTSLPFDHLDQHQVQSLLDSQNSTLYHRLTDQPWMEGRPFVFTKKKPFDCFVVVKVKAFVVVWFYIPRKPKIFFKIPIEVWLKERDTCGRKSITAQRASELGTAVLIRNGK